MPKLNKTAGALVSVLLWVGIPGAALALAFYFQAGLVVACFYAFLLLIAASRFMVFLWLRPLRCQRSVSMDVVSIGQEVEFKLTITNTAPWPVFWAYAEETLPPRMPVSGISKRLFFLPPGRSFEMEYKVTVMRRGCHQFGPAVLESGDVFGLFRRCRVEPHREFVTAVPNYQVLEEYEVGRQRNLGDFTALRSVFEDPTRIRGIREYQRGDAMNRIHWKSSARTGKLCSKLFDPVLEPGATVVLDFHRDSWKANFPNTLPQPPSEAAIELSATICRYLADGGWKVGFFSNGRDPLGLPGMTISQAKTAETLGEALQAAREGRPDDRLAPISIRASRLREQFGIIHENLGRMCLSDGLPIETLLLEELPHIDRQQVLVVITGEVTEAFLTGILRARELDYRIMIFVVCNNTAHDRAFELLVAHGVELFQMDEQWRMKEIATGRRSL